MEVPSLQGLLKPSSGSASITFKNDLGIVNPAYSASTSSVFGVAVTPVTVIPAMSIVGDGSLQPANNPMETDPFKTGRFRGGQPFSERFFLDQLNSTPEEETTDLVISCKDGQFDAHKFILSLSSDKAWKLLKDAPTKNARLVFPDYNINIVQKVFSMIYLGLAASDSQLEQFEIKELAKVLGIFNVELSRMTEAEQRSQSLLRLRMTDHTNGKEQRQEDLSQVNTETPTPAILQSPQAQQLPSAKNKNSSADLQNTQHQIPQGTVETPAVPQIAPSELHQISAEDMTGSRSTQNLPGTSTQKHARRHDSRHKRPRTNSGEQMDPSATQPDPPRTKKKKSADRASPGPGQDLAKLGVSGSGSTPKDLLSKTTKVIPSTADAATSATVSTLQTPISISGASGEGETLDADLPRVAKVAPGAKLIPKIIRKPQRDLSSSSHQTSCSKVNSKSTSVPSTSSAVNSQSKSAASSTSAETSSSNTEKAQEQEGLHLHPKTHTRLPEDLDIIKTSLPRPEPKATRVKRQPQALPKPIETVRHSIDVEDESDRPVPNAKESPTTGKILRPRTSKPRLEQDPEAGPIAQRRQRVEPPNKQTSEPDSSDSDEDKPAKKGRRRVRYAENDDDDFIVEDDDDDFKESEEESDDTESEESDSPPDDDVDYNFPGTSASRGRKYETRSRSRPSGRNLRKKRVIDSDPEDAVEDRLTYRRKLRSLSKCPDKTNKSQKKTDTEEESNSDSTDTEPEVPKNDQTETEPENDSDSGTRNSTVGVFMCYFCGNDSPQMGSVKQLVEHLESSLCKNNITVEYSLKHRRCGYCKKTFKDMNCFAFLHHMDTCSARGGPVLVQTAPAPAAFETTPSTAAKPPLVSTVETSGSITVTSTSSPAREPVPSVAVTPVSASAFVGRTSTAPAPAVAPAPSSEAVHSPASTAVKTAPVREASTSAEVTAVPIPAVKSAKAPSTVTVTAPSGSAAQASAAGTPVEIPEPADLGLSDSDLDSSDDERQPFDIVYIPIRGLPPAIVEYIGRQRLNSGTTFRFLRTETEGANAPRASVKLESVNQSPFKYSTVSLSQPHRFRADKRRPAPVQSTTIKRIVRRFRARNRAISGTAASNVPSSSEQPESSSSLPPICRSVKAPTASVSNTSATQLLSNTQSEAPNQVSLANQGSTNSISVIMKRKPGPKSKTLSKQASNMSNLSGNSSTAVEVLRNSQSESASTSILQVDNTGLSTPMSPGTTVTEKLISKRRPGPKSKTQVLLGQCSTAAQSSEGPTDVSLAAVRDPSRDQSSSSQLSTPTHQPTSASPGSSTSMVEDYLGVTEDDLLKQCRHCPICKHSYARYKECLDCIKGHGKQYCFICKNIFEHEPLLPESSFTRHCKAKSHAIVNAASPDDVRVRCPVNTCRKVLKCKGMEYHIIQKHLTVAALKNMNPDEMTMEESFQAASATASQFVRDGTIQAAAYANEIAGSSRAARRRRLSSPVHVSPVVSTPPTTEREASKPAKRPRTTSKDQKAEDGRKTLLAIGIDWDLPRSMDGDTHIVPTSNQNEHPTSLTTTTSQNPDVLPGASSTRIARPETQPAQPRANPITASTIPSLNQGADVPITDPTQILQQGNESVVQKVPRAGDLPSSTLNTPILHSANLKPTDQEEVQERATSTYTIQAADRNTPVLPRTDVEGLLVSRRSIHPPYAPSNSSTQCQQASRPLVNTPVLNTTRAPSPRSPHLGQPRVASAENIRNQLPKNSQLRQKNVANAGQTRPVLPQGPRKQTSLMPPPSLPPPIRSPKQPRPLAASLSAQTPRGMTQSQIRPQLQAHLRARAMQPTTGSPIGANNFVPRIISKAVNPPAPAVPLTPQYQQKNKTSATTLRAQTKNNDALFKTASRPQINSRQSILPPGTSAFAQIALGDSLPQNQTSSSGSEPSPLQPDPSANKSSSSSCVGYMSKVISQNPKQQGTESLIQCPAEAVRQQNEAVPIFAVPQQHGTESVNAIVTNEPAQTSVETEMTIVEEPQVEVEPIISTDLCPPTSVQPSELHALPVFSQAGAEQTQVTNSGGKEAEAIQVPPVELPGPNPAMQESRAQMRIEALSSFIRTEATENGTLLASTQPTAQSSLPIMEPRADVSINFQEAPSPTVAIDRPLSSNPRASMPDIVEENTVAATREFECTDCNVLFTDQNDLDEHICC